jgi:hypothetical protein
VSHRKKIKKTIDKFLNVCYNNYRKKGKRISKSQRAKKIKKKLKKPLDKLSK